MSAWSSGKIDKCEYFTCEVILPPDQSQVIEKAKFTCSHLEKTLENQIQTIEDQEKKSQSKFKGFKTNET